MEKRFVAWIEFGAILLVVGAVILFVFFCVLGVRWHYREKNLNKFLRKLKKPPIHAFETKTDLDSKIEERRQNVII